MSERRYNIRQVLAHPSVFDVKTARKIKGSVGSEPLDTFNTQGKETYLKALPYFEQVVQELFGLSVDELYALPVE